MASSLRTRNEQVARIRHVFGKHLDRPAIDITVQELQLTADAHTSASSAGRAVAYLKPLARWAAKRGLMQRGFHELEKPAERNTQDGGHSVLDRETLTKVLPAFDGHHGGAARMMLWTATRLDEVFGDMGRVRSCGRPLDDHSRTAKGHTQSGAKETSTSAATCYSVTSTSNFDADGDGSERTGSPRISEQPRR